MSPIVVVLGGTWATWIAVMLVRGLWRDEVGQPWYQPWTTHGKHRGQSTVEVARSPYRHARHRVADQIHALKRELKRQQRRWIEVNCGRFLVDVERASILLRPRGNRILSGS